MCRGCSCRCWGSCAPRLPSPMAILRCSVCACVCACACVRADACACLCVGIHSRQIACVARALAPPLAYPRILSPPRRLARLPSCPLPSCNAHTLTFTRGHARTHAHTQMQTQTCAYTHVYGASAYEPVCHRPVSISRPPRARGRHPPGRASVASLHVSSNDACAA
jgi:hypothetical protein